MKRSRLSILFVLPAFVLASCGGDDEPEASASEPTAEPSEAAEPEGTSMVDEVQAAFTESYGWPDDPAWSEIESFGQEGSSRIAVVSTLADKPENEDRAMQLCQAVSSVAGDLDDPPRVINVTAGDGGAFLAECMPFTG